VLLTAKKSKSLPSAANRDKAKVCLSGKSASSRKCIQYSSPRSCNKAAKTQNSFKLDRRASHLPLPQKSKGCLGGNIIHWNVLHCSCDAAFNAQELIQA